MFSFSFYLLCVVFCSRANGITTKSLPLILDNSSDTSQFVQIRSALNQPTRTFLVQHKSALSPAQQSHILDDVQKTQRIHYEPPHYSHTEDGQIKSFFGNNAPTSIPSSSSSSASSSSSNFIPNSNSLSGFNPNPNLFASFPQTSFGLNSLSPPPIQTVVLSPQQTLPTSPSNVNEYYTPYKASSQADFSNSANAFNHGNGNGNGNAAHSPSSSHKVFFPSATASNAVVQQPVDNSLVTKISEQNYNNGRYTTPIPHHHSHHTTSAKSETTAKTYLTKDPSSIFAPLVEKPKESSNSEKLIKEVYLKMNPEVLIAKDRQKFFQQLLEENRNEEEFVENSDDQTVAQNDLSGIRNQFEKEFMRQLKESVAASGPTSEVAGALANLSGVSEFSLPNGQKVQISKDYNSLLQEDDSGNKIKAIVVKQLPSSAASAAAPKSKSNILEELTKGVVPPGAEFEVIKRNKDGGLEEVSKLPQNIPQKKVTFVILEEQSDGTVRVQGVRGSEKESLKESGDEVDTIIKKIKEGELKLPPSTRLSPKQTQKSVDNGVASNKKTNLRGAVAGAQNDTKSKRKSAAVTNESRPAKRKEQSADKHFIPTPIVQAYTTPESTKSADTDTYATTPEQDSAYQYFSSPSTFLAADGSASASASVNYFGSSTPSYDDNPTILNQLASESWDTANSLFPESSSTPKISDNLGLFHLNNSGYIASLFSALKTPSFTFDSPAKTNLFQFPLLPTTLGNRVLEQARRNATKVIAVDDDDFSSNAYDDKKENYYKKRDRNAARKGNKKPIKETRKDNDEEESNVEETKSDDFAPAENYTLSEVLKKEGFYAMARFLRQSGLDSILNDTGPFTLFIPTDKAFRTLLIQLGGPDKAEEKFKENPRLLSGLLLHHVIPGAFRVNTLQDEMTGVSLAGTQLRVNTYTTHDIEWNDITVVTVNGAKILDEKDIVIPQGIAHAIDRVMFPLPVGNLLQSLQADRENRYSNFLKILEESELSYLLTGGKTFTLFAPLNRAFTHAEFTKILADPNESKSFILRHLVSGALYSAGMKYYQVRDSMEDGQQITLYKEAGRIKVNNAHVVTRNIPATNGVIHAIDAFL